MKHVAWAAALAVALSGAGIAQAADQPLSGRKLLVKRSASGKEKAVFLSKDTNIQGPVAGGGDDPTLVGATFDLCSNAGSASYVLPAEGWKSNKPGTVFKFVNKTAPNPPSEVKVALIKGGRTLKVVSKAAGLPLLGSEGAVGVRVTTGSIRQCALFEGDAVTRDQENFFKGKDADAGALADCSDEALGCVASPSGAFLDHHGGVMR